jgi:hypothetical protein
MNYSKRIREVLSPSERKFFATLTSPQKVQDYLDTLPINFEENGETYMSVRRMLREQTAHCLEGALLAAAVFAYHGQRPLLMDLRTVPNDEDHVIALFQINGYWGAISKTNHAMLRYRDPIYRDPRELAASYFHEYYVWDDDEKIFEDGEKTLREYSGPIDLTKYAPEKWVTAEEDLFWLAEAVDSVRHFPLVPKKNLKHLRPASRFEQLTHEPTEWKEKKPRE